MGSRDLVGKLVVASPGVPSGFAMSETVALILQQNDDVVFGVVVNQPAPEEALEAWQEFSGWESQQRLVAGGPVAGPVLALHQQPELAEMEVDGGLYVSVRKETIERLGELDFVDSPLPYRIVLGAVSWSDKLLAGEIEAGLWTVMDCDPDVVFGNPAEMWSQCARRCGRKLLSQVTGVRGFPASPLLN